MAVPKVELRPVRAEDSDQLLAWRNSPEVARWMFTDHQISPEEHARWFAGLRADESRADWIIELDGAPAGLASLYAIDGEERSGATASYLADPATRGRGVGTEVEALLIEAAFGQLGLSMLWCEVLASNAAGLRMHQKLGYRERPGPRRQVEKSGEPVDVVRLELSAIDWAGAG
jgi:UDP-4-amino-4,6-dideoxy-N-acetyl-beta-L-altrosamine N-acetyltransferase